MVNWTKESEQLEGTWKFDEKYDLPVPDSGYECMDLIHEAEDILKWFDYDLGALYDEYDEIVSDGISLLEEMTPRCISTLEHNNVYNESWKNSYKLWLFKNEVNLAAREPDTDHCNHLISACKCYLVLLKERFKQLMGETWEEEDA